LVMSQDGQRRVHHIDPDQAYAGRRTLLELR